MRGDRSCRRPPKTAPHADPGRRDSRRYCVPALDSPRTASRKPRQTYLELARPASKAQSRLSYSGQAASVPARRGPPGASHCRNDSGPHRRNEHLGSLRERTAPFPHASWRVGSFSSFSGSAWECRECEALPRSAASRPTFSGRPSPLFYSSIRVLCNLISHADLERSAYGS